MQTYQKIRRQYLEIHSSWQLFLDCKKQRNVIRNVIIIIMNRLKIK